MFLIQLVYDQCIPKSRCFLPILILFIDFALASYKNRWTFRGWLNFFQIPKYMSEKTPFGFLPGLLESQKLTPTIKTIVPMIRTQLTFAETNYQWKLQKTLGNGILGSHPHTDLSEIIECAQTTYYLLTVCLLNTYQPVCSQPALYG